MASVHTMSDIYGNEITVRDAMARPEERTIFIAAPYPMKGIRDWQGSEIARAMGGYMGAPVEVVKLSGRWSVVGKPESSYWTIEECLSAHYGVHTLRFTE